MTKVKHIAVVFFTFCLALATLFAFSNALQRRDSLHALTVGTPVTLPEVTIEAEDHAVNQEDILWLARVILSETERPHEQELVAWIVRNRVETKYRGSDSYQEVVLDPWQFSAFNEGDPKRGYFMSLTEASQELGWQKALEIATRVAKADGDVRPFNKETRHFYSEQSMVGGRAPKWAKNQQPVKLAQHVEAKRFRFYAGIS
jgi:hypothetical protein